MKWQKFPTEEEFRDHIRSNEEMTGRKISYWLEAGPECFAPTVYECFLDVDNNVILVPVYFPVGEFPENHYNISKDGNPGFEDQLWCPVIFFRR